MFMLLGTAITACLNEFDGQKSDERKNVRPRRVNLILTNDFSSEYIFGG
jgi:hypothetical protein